MSQNKTIVPGVDYNSLGNTELEDSIYGNLYSRSGVSDNRTYIPDVSRPSESSTQGVILQRGDPFGNDKTNRYVSLQNRVVSVSAMQPFFKSLCLLPLLQHY